MLLVPASADAAMGEATFLSESLPGAAVFVRPVNPDEIKSEARKLKGVEATQFDALLALRRALEAQDDLVMADAIQRMERVYSSFENDLTPYGYHELLEGIRPGPKTLKRPARLLSFEISRIVGNLNTHIVLWWNAGRFYPGIFCLDMTTAIYVHTFFIAPTGGLGFRICPRCRDQFLQRRPNQEYCCTAHRDAHRVARFRANPKNRERKEQGQHGAQETR